MADQPSTISPVKLGLAVAWPAFWTGVPAKFVVVLLLLAAGLHPWEMPGLAFLLLLSIPVDIWATGLSARTVFLERLRVNPQPSLGLTLWWQGAAFSAVYLPIAYVVETQTAGLAKGITEKIMEIEILKSLPVAERIGIDLTMWGSVAAVMLLVLILAWLSIFGWIVRRQAILAAPSDASYQALVRQWDLSRVPADQPLLLTAFTATGVLLIVLFWGFLPATTPHPHELYKKEAPKPVHQLKPVEALQKSEKLLAQAEATVQSLEEKAKEEETKGKGKGKAKDQSKGAAGKNGAGAKVEPAKAAAAARPDHADAHAADGHKH
ncbi:MAG: hypothetical protein AB1411_02780 [Nitrospirota bacterium]